MESQERQELLRSHVLGRAWLEVIKPEYESRLKKEIFAYVADGDERHKGIIEILLWALAPQLMEKRVARARGRIAGLKALLSWPEGEVTQVDRENDRERAFEEAMGRAKHYAEWGWRSPVAPPDEE